MQRPASLVPLLLFAAACALAAAGLAAGGYNRPLFEAINTMAFAGLPAALPSCLTLLGHGLAAVMLLAPWLARASQVLVAALFAAPIAGIFSGVGKRLVATPRPAAVLDPAGIHVQGQVLAGHNAFPSGHSITMFLVATVLVLGLPSLRSRPVAALGVLVLTLACASSRVMVGAHWPGDVLGGAVLGILAGMAGTALAQRWPFWRHARARSALALVVMICALVLAQTDTGYPLARPLQWALAALGLLAAIRTIALARAAATAGPAAP